MSEQRKMSVADILAACRGTDAGLSSSEEKPTKAPSQPADSGGADETPEVGATSAAESGVPEPGPTSSAPPKPAGQMSLNEILAAARSADGGTAPKAAAAPKASAPKSADAAKPAGVKKAGEMSMADILAAARGEGSAAKAASPKPAAAKPAAAKPAAAKPAAGTGAKATAKAGAGKPSGPMDTSSILAAARTGSKPGPISKAEAAAQAKPAAPATAKTKPSAPPMPAKPAFAKPSAKAAEQADRRGFFAVFLGSFLALGFTTLGLTSVGWTLGLARFMFPNILIEPPSRFKVGFPSDFAPGTVETKFKAQFGVWIVNVEYEGQQEIVALKTVCTHLGCTPNWLEAEQKFKCPCHGSGFYKDGINFEGPAPRPLERYAIQLADDGQLAVDKSKTFQQEMGQWSDPACAVPV